MTYRTNGATFTRESVEAALELHTREGRLRAWHNWHEDRPARSRPLYTVTMAGGHTLDLATLHEAHTLLAGLTSASDAARKAAK